MKKYLILLLICNCVGTTVLYGQKSLTDSLQQLLQQVSAQKEKARLTIKLGKAFIDTDTLKAKQFIGDGLQLAEQAGDDMAKGMHYLYTAYLLCNKGQFEKGLQQFEQSAVYFNRFAANKTATQKEKDENMELLLDAEISMGNVYLELFEYEKAVNVFTRFIKLISKSNFPFKDAASASAYQSMGLAYYHQAQYAPALKYYLQAAESAAKGTNKEEIAFNKIYAAMCYNLLKNYNSAKLLLNEVSVIAEGSSNLMLKVQYYARRAELLRFSGQYADAILFYDKAIANSRQTGNVYMQSTFLHAKAKCLLALNKANEAKAAAEEALQLAKSINKKREILESQKILSESDAMLGNYRSAYAYLKEHVQGKDSLHSEEITSSMLAMEKKYQTELKETKIKDLESEKRNQQLLLNKTRTLNLVLTGLAILLVLTGLLFYRNHLQRQRLHLQRITELETEKQLAATEAVLKGEEQERTRLAKDLHDGLGGMLSGIKHSMHTMKGNVIMTPENQQAFERSIDMLDSSIKEMRRVAHNLMPESLVKFGLDTAVKDFCNDMNESGAVTVSYQSIGLQQLQLDETAGITIYRIVQELINNVMKHAAAQSVIVQMNHTDGLLSITVEDDGKGFDTNLLKGTKGIGWSNIENRVEFMKGRWDVESQPGKGTSVHIEFDV